MPHGMGATVPYPWSRAPVFLCLARLGCLAWGPHASSLGLDHLFLSSKYAFLAFLSHGLSGFPLSFN